VNDHLLKGGLIGEHDLTLYKITDSVEEAVARLNRQLDDEDEDRVAILCAPESLARFAIFRYAAERVLQSAPDNIQELRERGFLR
jgi:hypothetical protein